MFKKNCPHEGHEEILQRVGYLYNFARQLAERRHKVRLTLHLTDNAKTHSHFG